MANQEERKPGDEFLGEWRVMANSIRDEPDEPVFALIERGEGKNEFALYSRTGKDRRFHQVMLYCPSTGTLENRLGERERCIAFWGRRRRNPKSPNSIFAKRIQEVGVPYDEPLLPWEEGDVAGQGNGTWGAEEGGG
jgi:hypothetical protein